MIFQIYLQKVQNCVLRSRYHSKWAAIIDIDERLTMTEYNGTIADYLRYSKLLEKRKYELQ